MCGIAGIISPDISDLPHQRLKRMTDAIQHRGPDGDGFWFNSEGTIGLGHRRLSIIDLSEAAAQPMHYLDRYIIIYNGEIYNYIELRAELAGKGYTFLTQSDTEVILAAYACYGKDCLQYFDGMFAFAIWDKAENSLFCARDRFGEKPFYYSYDTVSSELILASEIKALWAAGIEKKPSNGMLLNYLTLGFVQHPLNKEKTFFDNVFSLPPSHYLIYKFLPNNKSDIAIRNYWDIDKESIVEGLSEDEIKQKFAELFTTSVQRRLRSDVPIGSSLSGGLDSSSIVAIVNRLLDDKERQKTFSAVFPGFDKDESRYINEVVKKFSVDNFSVTPQAEDFVKDLYRLIHHQDEPFQSASIYAQYKVYELARQKGVKVILDGQGADEMLCGYTKYYHWFWQEKIGAWRFADARKEIQLARRNGQQIDWGFRNYLAAFLPQVAANRLQKKVHSQQVNRSEVDHDFVHDNIDKASHYKPTVTKLNDILYFNTMHFGLEELLRYADRNSMAHSREVRLPFLNHELVQFVFSLPSSCKIHNGYTKHLLRLCMQDMLPDAIVWRKNKVGFEPPQKQWMQDERVIELMHESRRTLVNKGVLKQAVLNRTIKYQDAHDANNYDWRYLCAAQVY